MDLLNLDKTRRAILDFYQNSGEPEAVEEAIRTAQKQASSSINKETAINKKEKYVWLKWSFRNSYQSGRNVLISSESFIEV